MFNLNKETRNYSLQETMETMQEDTNKFGVFIDLENAYYNNYWYSKIRNDAMYFLKMNGFQIQQRLNQESIKPSDIIDFAVNNKFNAYLGQTERGSVSLAAEGIRNFLSRLDNLDLDNKLQIKNVMEAYLRYKDASYYTSTLNGESNNYLRLNRCQLLSKDKHAMAVVRPQYEPQNTGRFGPTNPNIAGIPKDLVKPLITVPEGYILCVVDMGQVDPRLFANLILCDPVIDTLINMYNDAYFGFLHYCTMSDIEATSGNFQKREITEEMKQQRQQIKTMTNATIYGKNIKDEDIISVAYKKKLSNHPNRLKLINKCKAELDNGITIFKTMLGTPIDVTKTDERSIEKHGLDDLPHARLRKAVNAQIQGLTADIIRYSYMTIREYLRQNAPGSLIITQVHDSLKFMISEKELPQIKDYINNCLAFKIDGCNIPINCEATWYYPNDKVEEFVSNV